MEILEVDCDPKARLVEVDKMANRIRREGYILKFSSNGFYFITDAPERLMTNLGKKFKWIKRWDKIQI